MGERKEEQLKSYRLRIGIIQTCFSFESLLAAVEYALQETPVFHSCEHAISAGEQFSLSITAYRLPLVLLSQGTPESFLINRFELDIT